MAFNIPRDTHQDLSRDTSVLVVKRHPIRYILICLFYSKTHGCNVELCVESFRAIHLNPNEYLYYAIRVVIYFYFIYYY